MTNTFPIWKTVKLGAHKDVVTYSAAMDTMGCQRNDFVAVFTENDMFPHGEVDFVRITARELGLSDREHLYKDACSAGVGLGLQLCTREMGMALRLAHDAHSVSPSEHLNMAMKPVMFKYPKVHFMYGSCFLVLRHEKSTLFFEGWIPADSHERYHSPYGDEFRFYGRPGDEYIFVKPRV